MHQKFDHLSLFIRQNSLYYRFDSYILNISSKFLRTNTFYVPLAQKLVSPLQLRVTECCVFRYRGI